MMSCDTCFTSDFKDLGIFDPGPVNVLRDYTTNIQALLRCLPTVSASHFLDVGLLDDKFRMESNCLGFDVLADTGDAEGEEPVATGLAVDLGLFFTPVMLLRFPWHRYKPTTRFE